jgi:hypothetical protein
LRHGYAAESEFLFDKLRKRPILQRPFHYAVADEKRGGGAQSQGARVLEVAANPRHRRLTLQTLREAFCIQPELSRVALERRLAQVSLVLVEFFGGLPKFTLFGGALAGFRSLLCLRVNTLEGEVAEYKPNLIPVMRTDLAHGRLSDLARRALEIGELNDGHRRLRISYGMTVRTNQALE